MAPESAIETQIKGVAHVKWKSLLMHVKLTQDS